MTLFNEIYFAIRCFARSLRNGDDQSHALATVFVAAFGMVHIIAIYFLCAYMFGFKPLASAESKPYLVGGAVALISVAWFHYVLKGNGDRVVAEMGERKNTRRAELIGGLIVAWIFLVLFVTMLGIGFAKQLGK